MQGGKYRNLSQILLKFAWIKYLAVGSLLFALTRCLSHHWGESRWSEVITGRLNNLVESAGSQRFFPLPELDRLARHCLEAGLSHPDSLSALLASERILSLKRKFGISAISRWEGVSFSYPVLQDSRGRPHREFLRLAGNLAAEEVFKRLRRHPLGTKFNALGIAASVWGDQVRILVILGLWLDGKLRPLEDELLQYLNRDRRRYGLSPLRMDETLRQVARLHSEDMRDRQFFSHINPDGLRPKDRVRYYAGLTFQKVGENIGKDMRQTRMSFLESVFMESPGHRENILWPYYKRVGIGIALDSTHCYVTEIFVP